MVVRKTGACIIDDLRPDPSKGGQPDELPDDHGDMATPEPSAPTEDDRPLD